MVEYLNEKFWPGYYDPPVDPNSIPFEERPPEYWVSLREARLQMYKGLIKTKREPTSITSLRELLEIELESHPHKEFLNGLL